MRALVRTQYGDVRFVVRGSTKQRRLQNLLEMWSNKLGSPETPRTQPENVEKSQSTISESVVVSSANGTLQSSKQLGIVPQSVMKVTKNLKNPAFCSQLVKFERSHLSYTFKFGVLYVKEGQSTENEMFSNLEGSHGFDNFLELLGDRVRLKHWRSFRGGLDTQNDLTGTESIYTQFHRYELMFHVSTLLPFSNDDPQQLERKRHIGNDVVLLIFNDSKQPFCPNILQSHFNHVFVVISPVPSATRKYRIAIATKFGVRPSGPLLPHPAILDHSEKTREWLLSKLINLERAAMHAPAFRSVLSTSRKYMLQDLANFAKTFSKSKNKA